MAMSTNHIIVSTCSIVHHLSEQTSISVIRTRGSYVRFQTEGNVLVLCDVGNSHLVVCGTRMGNIKSSCGDGYWYEAKYVLLVRTIKCSYYRPVDGVCVSNLFPSLPDGCVMKPVCIARSGQRVCNDSRTQAVVLPADGHNLYIVPGVALDSHAGPIEDQLFTLCTDIVVDRIIRRYTQDVEGGVVLLDNTSWHACRHLTRYIDSVIDDSGFEWDEDELAAQPNIFGHITYINTMNEYIDCRTVGTTRLYVCRDAINELGSMSLPCPVVFMTYDREDLLKVTSNNRCAHSVFILLCTRELESDSPRVDYVPVTLQDCISSIPSLEFVFNNINPDSVLMYVPQQLALYI